MEAGRTLERLLYVGPAYGILCGDGQTSRLTGAHNNALWEFPNSPSHSLLGDHRHATLQRVFLDS
eukprot:scaffold100323_cov25-Cyclotella_meneghiniana.AAC.2